MMLVSHSPRTRRRLAWLAAALVAAAVAAGVIALLPKGSTLPTQTAAPGASEVVPVTERQVRLSRVDRRKIDALLDRFVPSAFARRDPGASYALATPALRAGTPRRDWSRGDLPVSPYEPRGTTFHAWHLNYAFAGEVNLDLLLHPAKAGGRPEIFKVDVKRLDGRWLVDAVVPQATFAPEGKAPSSNLHAVNDFKPALVGQAGRAQLSTWWFLLPGALLGLVVLVPLALLVGSWVRKRRVPREPLPPLPTLRR